MCEYNTKSERREKKRFKEKYSPVSHKNTQRLENHKKHIPKAVKKILESKIKVKIKSKKWKKY